MMPPKELSATAAETAIKINPANAPAVHQLRQAMPDVKLEPDQLSLLISKYWGVGGVRLTVSFLDNPPADLRARLLMMIGLSTEPIPEWQGLAHLLI